MLKITKIIRLYYWNHLFIILKVSKISETSRSYENIFNYLKKYNDQYIFIWNADGKGLESIKNDLSTKIELHYIFNKTNFIDVIKKKLNLK
ncbi:MAG: hypothetical protein IKJ03_00095 [Mycoplasmataceae bacterium]|nr:hypothetical protein [Mycoplasmataceae bacterium]